MEKPEIYVVVESLGGVAYVGDYYTSRERAEEVERHCVYEGGSEFSEKEMKDFLGDSFVPEQDNSGYDCEYLYHPELKVYFSTSKDDWDVHVEKLRCGD